MYDKNGTRIKVCDLVEYEPTGETGVVLELGKTEDVLVGFGEKKNLVNVKDLLSRPTNRIVTHNLG